MRLLAPAKLNLHLRVGPPRADGFHPLMSWFVTAGLFDTLKIEIVGKQEDWRGENAPISISCNWLEICNERNLVTRVLAAWEQEARKISGDHVCPLHITLHKEIPAGAGLGGGSSDGARALIGANELWKSGVSVAQLAEFAGRFGSDLPFFFHGPSSVCTGRRENVTSIAPPKPRFAVLVLPDIAMPTPQVYRRFDEMNLGNDRDVNEQPDWNAWTNLDAKELLPLLVNDLEPPAFSLDPRLARLHHVIAKSLQRPVRMSGSGSSLFTLFDDPQEAQESSARVQGEFGVRALAIQIAPRIDDDFRTE
jgi:4-diphosphocytidyl-2-C-methyl-D-erythritol kinase